MSIPARFLIDANVVLDAAFVEDGDARNALRALRARGSSIIIEEIATVEIKTRVGALFPAQRAEGESLVALLIAEIGILSVPPGDTAKKTLIRSHDAHLERGADDYDAALVTNDIHALVSRRKAGADAFSPAEIVFKSGYSCMPLPARFEVVPVAAVATIMSWVTPGAWAGVPRAGLFPVFEQGNVSVYFDLSQRRGRWVLSINGFEALNIPDAFGTDETFLVGCVLYSAERDRCALFCRGTYKQTGLSARTFARAAVTDSGRLHFGSMRNNQHHWNGYIRSHYHLPEAVGKERAKAISSVQDLGPPTQTGILERAARAMHAHLGMIPARVSECGLA